MKCLDCGHDLTMDEAEEHREMGHTVKDGFFEETGTMNWQETDRKIYKALFGIEASEEFHIVESEYIPFRKVWEARQKEVDEAEQRGIRKVVEWVNKQKVFGDGNREGNGYIEREEWQAFLKGVEK